MNPRGSLMRARFFLIASALALDDKFDLGKERIFLSGAQAVMIFDTWGGLLAPLTADARMSAPVLR